MSLILPSKENYINASKESSDFFDREGLSYCVYGSFLVPEKLRYGLSDIDIFVISDSENILFPIEIQMKFSQVKSSIERLGIPLQVNWTTKSQIKSSFFSPDSNYIDEVKKGIEKGLKSNSFEEDIKHLSSRNMINDDEHMARYFFRKINELGLYIQQIYEVMPLEESKIDIEMQRKMVKLWGTFKKMISLYALIIRIISGKSLFSRKENEITDTLKQFIKISSINTYKYTNRLSEIGNINDWFYFLKNGGLNEMVDIYNSIFIPILKLISEKFQCKT